jgi:hypothetical protein
VLAQEEIFGSHWNLVKAADFLENWDIDRVLGWKIPVLREVNTRQLERFTEAKIQILKPMQIAFQSEVSSLPRKIRIIETLLKLFFLLPRLIFHKVAKEQLSGKGFRNRKFALLKRLDLDTLLQELLVAEEAWSLPRKSHSGKPQKDGQRIKKTVASLCRQNKVGTACKALEQESPVQIDDDIRTQLQQKFPPAKYEYRAISSCSPAAPNWEISQDDLVKAARRSNRHTAPGLSGMSNAMLLHSCYKDSPEEKDEEFVELLIFLVELTLSGHAGVNKFLRDGRLCAIAKLEEGSPCGARPIIITECLRRFVAKVLLEKNKEAIAQHFKTNGDVQLGLERAAIEKAFFRCNSALEGDDQVGCFLDLKNAFNTISRAHVRAELVKHFPEWTCWFDCLYEDGNKLVFTSGSPLTANEGILQGDPLGPFLFSLALNPVLMKMKGSCPSLSVAGAYLDDCFLVGKVDEVCKATRLFRQECELLGLDLTTHKCKVFSKDFDEDKMGLLRETLSHYGLSDMRIVLKDEGIKLLGCPIGSDKFVTKVLAVEMRSLRAKLNRLGLIADMPQEQMLILRCCIVPSVGHLFRTTSPTLAREAAFKFDLHVNKCLEKYFGAGCFPKKVLKNFSKWPIQFCYGRRPIGLGGLGLKRATNTLEAAWIAGLISAWDALNRVTKNKLVRPLSECFKRLDETSLDAIHKIPVALQELLSSRSTKRADTLAKLRGRDGQLDASKLKGRKHLQRLIGNVVESRESDMLLRRILNQYNNRTAHRLARFLSNECRDSVAFATVVPTTPDLAIGPLEYRYLLSRALDMPVPGRKALGSSKCDCGKVLDEAGHHLFNCFRTFAHDSGVRAIKRMCGAARLLARVEPYGCTVGGDLKRPDLEVLDLLANGKGLLLDLTTVDVGAPSHLNAKEASFEVVGAAAKSAAEAKIKKFAASFNPSHYEFRPLVVDTGGRMDKNLKGLIRQVARAATENKGRRDEDAKEAHQTSFGFFWRNVISVAIAKGFARSAISNTRQIFSRETTRGSKRGKGGNEEENSLEFTLIPCGYR